MTIYNTAYSTTIGSSVVISNIEHALEKALTMNDQNDINRAALNVAGISNKAVYFVTGYLEYESEIPSFIHPLMLAVKEKTYVCCDIRPYIASKKSAYDNIKDLEIKNVTEYNFSVARAILTLAWVSGQMDRIKHSLAFAGEVFTVWLSDTISKRYALNPRDKMIVSVICYAYYQSLFTDKNKLDEDDIRRISSHTMSVTNAPSDMVLQIFNQLGDLRDINSLCENIKEITGAVSLNTFNSGMLVSMINNSWSGADGGKIVSVGLEHIPTWLALIYTAASERTYKYSAIARVLELIGKRGKSTEYVEAFEFVIEQFKPEKNRPDDNERFSFKDFD